MPTTDSATWWPTPAACLGGEEVAGRGPEEVHHRVVLERRRVGHVDDHVGAVERVGQALAGERVDAGVGDGGDGLVAVLAELGDELGADESGAADDDDLHVMPFGWVWSQAAVSRCGSFQPGRGKWQV